MLIHKQGLDPNICFSSAFIYVDRLVFGSRRLRRLYRRVLEASWLLHVQPLGGTGGCDRLTGAGAFGGGRSRATVTIKQRFPLPHRCTFVSFPFILANYAGADSRARRAPDKRSLMGNVMAAKCRHQNDSVTSVCPLKL